MKPIPVSCLLPLVLIAGIVESKRAIAQIAAEIRIVDERDRPLPCCVYLQDEDGKPVRPPALPFWRDHFCCDGTAELQLREGRYNYTIERGPEYGSLTGVWNLTLTNTDRLTGTLPRLYDLSSEGWHCGELHIHRPARQAALLLQASDLDVGPVITWWNQRNPWSNRALPAATLQRTEDGRFFDVMAGEDERGGGALLYFGLSRPLPIAMASREYPASSKYLSEATRATAPISGAVRRVHVDIEKPFWKDVPLWLASEKVDSIGIAHNHLWRSGVLENEAWGRARDVSRWPPPHGNGLWSQSIYFHALNCGFRIPPSAGSASGVLPNPVGYNRCYVHLDGPLDYFRWWQGLRAGRVFVTNGPLLTVKANGRLPGHTFAAAAGPLEISLIGTLRSADSIDSLQIIRNGKVIHELPVADKPQQPIEAVFDVSAPGWFLVRAIAENEQTLRFGMTGPFYVGGADQQRALEPESAEFFLNWARERRDELARLLQGSQRDEVIAEHDAAVAFWERKLESAK